MVYNGDMRAELIRPTTKGPATMDTLNPERNFDADYPQCATCNSYDVFVTIVADDPTDPRVIEIEVNCNECGSITEERVRA